jgi:hypothetical protein
MSAKPCSGKCQDFETSNFLQVQIFFGSQTTMASSKRQKTLAEQIADLEDAALRGQFHILFFPSTGTKQELQISTPKM